MRLINFLSIYCTTGAKTNKTSIVYKSLKNKVFNEQKSVNYFFAFMKNTHISTELNFINMNIEEYRNFCLSLKATSEDLPFDANTLVFKVKNKMFALTNIETFASINLKCDPENAILLREKYQAVNPGFHMNKKHWNTITVDGTIPNKLILEWTKDSYNLVISKLPKKTQKELQN